MNLSRNDAAKRLGVHRNTIAAWVRAGRLASNPDHTIPIEGVEKIEQALAAYRAATGPAMDAAELLSTQAGERHGIVLSHIHQLASEIVRLGHEISGRGMVDPVANRELFETIRVRISEIASLDVELAALDHVLEIARDIATSPSPRAALTRAYQDMGRTPEAAAELVSQLDDNQVQSRLAELPQLLMAREGEEHA